MSVAAPFVLRAMREDRGRFAALRDTRVLIYWPHGLGDWVTFGGIAPLLEPSNAYAMTRFGDDYVAVMDDNAIVQPLPSGVRALGDGSALGKPHFGLRLRDCNGRPVALEVPPPLDAAVARFAPQVLLWTDYPETEGRTPYPFHTKARNLARMLVAPERLARFDLSQPLANVIDFSAPRETQRRVDERLAQLASPGTRVAVISRSGFTAARKNWGDGSEARAFAAALRGHSTSWRFISMDDDDAGDGSATFRSLFGDVDEPFAEVYKALARRLDLFAGIPAGPLHFTLARGGVPAVGLWLTHHPDWYDEPNPNAIHLVGSYVRERGFDRRPASTTKPHSLAHRIVYLDSPKIAGDDVLEAVIALIR
jgi:hypothetical protein